MKAPKIELPKFKKEEKPKITPKIRTCDTCKKDCQLKDVRGKCDFHLFQGEF